MIYAGVGSRGTPAIFNFFCSLVGEYAAMRGMALWSGDCHGPDRSFYHGQMEAVRKGYDVPVGMIWKAWPGHNANLNYLLKARRPIDYQMFSECSMAVQNECRRILFEVKPKLKDKWGAFNTRTGRPVMGNGAKALLSRDVLQVLGPMLLTPSDPIIKRPIWSSSTVRRLTVFLKAVLLLRILSPRRMASLFTTSILKKTDAALLNGLE